MAKHVILESYSFTPSTRSVVVTGKNIRREQLLLITNVTRNTVIYNFSDPNLGATSYVNTVSATGAPGIGTNIESTTLLLAYNTTAMSSTDRLSILVEETYQEITPAESQLDPVGKMRVSEPQSLIDTDFEYGVQPTKWESIALINNRPTAFFIQSPVAGIPSGFLAGTPQTNWQAQPGQLNISNVHHSGGGNTQITVSIADTIGPNLYVGQPIYVQGTLDTANADGWFVIEQITGNVSFSYRTTSIPVTNVPTSVIGSNILYDPTKTYVYAGAFYSNSAIAVNNVSVTGGVIYVNTTNAHGLTPGNQIMITNTSGITGVGVLAGTGLNGIWNVANTPTSNTLIANGYVGTTFTAGGATLATAANTLYIRPSGFVQHRAFDGGVAFTTQNPAHNSQFVRQTRRYFRYQSGKGVQFSTGSIMRPSVQVDTITSSGTTVTITTKFPHGLGIGANVAVSGPNESGYSGLWPVASVPSALSFTYTSNATPGATTATGFPLVVSPYSWYGSRNRLGMFDEQNGFFFEYDGQQLYAVKRSSTQQISGQVSANTGNTIVTGNSTKFGTQLSPGDMIVIRGTSYRVQSIESDTIMNIFPEYRGVNVFNSQCSKTIDSKYPQSSWNIDKLDGTGHSLYNIDPSRMQMWYMDFSWYGAGAIRFGVKNNRGEVIYCHRIVNSNMNTEAYMRSGNLPSRYETATYAPTTILGATLASSATTGAGITVVDANLFPNIGTVIVQQAGNRNANIEYISYSAKTGNVLTIGGRALAGGTTTASQFTYSSNTPTQVSLFSPQFASTMSHWGSAVIMDGKYDDDKSLVFNIGQNVALANLPSNNRYGMISLRIAPSVDNGITGLLGAREINNRMQLVLRQMDSLTTAPYRIDVILNGTPAEGIWQNVGGSSLAQYVLHANATPIVGGENMFSFFTNSAGTTQQDMTLARDLGTSIITGGATRLANAFLGKFPDGPDMITICATNLSPAGVPANINARISWTEAQA
jgi:hypothetical protein